MVVPVEVPLVGFLVVGLGLPLALGSGPYIVKVIGGELEVRGEPNESKEESKCRLSGGLIRLRREGVGRLTGN